MLNINIKNNKNSELLGLGWRHVSDESMILGSAGSPFSSVCLTGPSHVGIQIFQFKVTREMGFHGKDLGLACGCLEGQEFEFPISQGSTNSCCFPLSRRHGSIHPGFCFALCHTQNFSLRGFFLEGVWFQVLGCVFK